MTNADRVETGRPSILDSQGFRLVIGMLAFVGAVLAILLLLIRGGVLLVIAFFVEMISQLGPPKGRDGFGSILFLPAIMVVSGLCLGSGLLELAFRGLAGRPLAGKVSILRFCVIPLTLAFATVIAVVVIMAG